MTEAQARSNVVSIAQGFNGCKENDGSHKKIIDIYNSHKPLARGYAMKYTDAWCACFVSTVSIQAGYTDIMPTECGCAQMIELYKKLGTWQENDAYTPKPGDVIFYDWEDSGNSDNIGLPDHVGVVVSVTGTTIKIIEGNISNAVGFRNIAVNGKYIRGYGLPNYAKKATGAATVPAKQPTTPAQPQPSPTVTLSAGDVVTFTGTTHYTSANAASGVSCKPGKANITSISKGSKHPYHLINISGGGSTVYGWVDAKDVKVATSAPASAPSPTIKVGSKVKVRNGAKTYTGGGLASFVYQTVYLVRELSGDKAIIAPAATGPITAAVKAGDLIVQ